MVVGGDCGLMTHFASQSLPCPAGLSSLSLPPCVFSCCVTAPNRMLQSSGLWRLRAGDSGPNRTAFLSASRCHRPQVGRYEWLGVTPMAGPHHLDSAAPLCQYWWRWWVSAGLINHSTWMRPLQGGGLWAPANRAERLMSRVRHSAICCHRPPGCRRGRGPHLIPGCLPEKSQPRFHPATPTLCLPRSCWGRESSRPRAFVHVVLSPLLRTAAASFPMLLPSPPFSSLPSANPLSVAVLPVHLLEYRPSCVYF